MDVVRRMRSEKALLELVGVALALGLAEHCVRAELPGMLPYLTFAPHSRRLLRRILVEMSMGMSLKRFWPFFTSRS